MKVLAKIVATIFFLVGLALYTPLPYLAGILHAIALIIAFGSNEDDDDDEGPRFRKPVSTPT